MFNFSTGFVPQFGVNDYAQAAPLQSTQPRRKTLQELLSSFAESRRTPFLSPLQPLVDYADFSDSDAPVRIVNESRKPRRQISAPQMTQERPVNREQLAYGPLPGTQESPQNVFPRNLTDQAPQRRNDLNPEQTNQIQEWERNAAEAEKQLRERDRGLAVALAGTPDQPQQEDVQPRRQANAFGDAIPQRQRQRQRQQQQQPAPPELSLQQQLRMMGEQQAPTSLMIQAMIDDRQRRASQPPQPGEIEITPGLPGLDSMRLYQRQRNDPMMSSEDKQINLNRDLQANQLGADFEKFQGDLEYKREDMGQRRDMFDEEQRSANAREVSRQKQAENDRKSREKTSWLDFWSRQQNPDQDVMEWISRESRNVFGGSSQPEPDAQAQRGLKQMYDSRISSDQNLAIGNEAGSRQAPTSSEEVRLMKAATATTLADLFIKEGMNPREMLERAKIEDAKSPLHKGLVQESLKKRLQDWRDQLQKNSEANQGLTTDSQRIERERRRTPAATQPLRRVPYSVPGF